MISAVDGLIPLELTAASGLPLTGQVDPGTTNPAGFGYGASEVKIYNRALSAEEIKRLYNIGEVRI